MACSACGGKQRRPLRQRTGAPVAQQPVRSGTSPRSVIDNMRYATKK